SGVVLTVNSNISGAGALTKRGAGTLILSGNNSYAGGLVIQAGTVSIASDTQLGATVVPAAPDANGALSITLDGGTLRVTGSTTMDSDRTMLLGDNNGTIDVASGVTFTNPAFTWGRGGLTKVGTGTMVLNSSDTNFSQYLGTTTISGGTMSYVPNGVGNFVGLANSPPAIVPNY